MQFIVAGLIALSIGFFVHLRRAIPAVGPSGEGSGKTTRSPARAKNVAWLAGGTIALLALLCVFVDPVAPGKPTRPKVITVYSVAGAEGQPPSPYTLLAEYFASELESELDGSSYSIELVPTSGSLETVLSFDTPRGEPGDEEDQRPEHDEQLAIGIVQSDVLFHYLHGSHPQFQNAPPDSQVRAITSLFDEYIYTYLSPPEVLGPLPPSQPALEFQDFAGQRYYPVPLVGLVLEEPVRIFGGSQGSGSLVSALNVIDAIAPGHVVHRTAATTPEAVHRLSFQTISPRSSKPRPRGAGLAFLSLATLRLLEHNYPKVYRRVTARSVLEMLGARAEAAATSHSFPPSDPSPRLEGLHSLSVRAVLVGSNNLPSDAVLALRRSLRKLFDEHHSPPTSAAPGVAPRREQLRTIVAQTGLGDTWGTERISFPQAWSEMCKDLPIAAHPTIQLQELTRFERALAKMTLIHVLGLTPLFLVAGVYLLREFRRTSAQLPLPKRLRQTANRQSGIATAAGLFVLLHVAIAVLLWHAELQHQSLNPTSGSLADLGGAFRQIALYVLTGSVGTALESNVSLIYLGMLKGGYAVASIWAFYVLTNQLLQLGKRMSRKEHTIIFGWNDYGRFVAGELIDQGAQLSIVTLKSQTEIEIECDKAEEYSRPDQYVETVGPGLKPALTAARIGRADALIILSDREWSEKNGCADVDFWVVKVLQEARAMLAESRRPIRIIAEVAGAGNESTVRAAGADEALCVERFGVELLAQLAVKPRLKDLFDELLDTKDGTNEIYYVPLPRRSKDRPKTYSELSKKLLAIGPRAGSPMTPIGILRRRANDPTTREVVINPSKQDGALREGDEVILIAQKKPSRAEL